MILDATLLQTSQHVSLTNSQCHQDQSSDRWTKERHLAGNDATRIEPKDNNMFVICAHTEKGWYVVFISNAIAPVKTWL